MGDPALMISLYPEFPADVMSSLASQGEFIFVVDRSGSMSCEMHHGKDAQSRIESARVRCRISDLTHLLTCIELICTCVSPGHAAAAAEEFAHGMLLQHLWIRL